MPPNNEGFDHGVSYYAAIVFGVLTICVAVTGVYTRRTLNLYVPKGSKRRSQVDVFSHISAMYFVVFLTRAVWSMTYICNDNWLQTMMNKWENSYPKDHDAREDYYIALMGFYLVFEVLPTVILLIGFWVWLRPGKKRSLLANMSEGKPLINDA